MGYASVFDAWFRTQSYILETYASVQIIVEQVSNPNENSLTTLTSTLRTFREKKCLCYTCRNS